MLSANYEYSRSNRENLSLPIQMQLSAEPNAFWAIFVSFLKSMLTFEFFRGKNESHSPSISEVTNSKKRAYLNVLKVLLLKTL